MPVQSPVRDQHDQHDQHDQRDQRRSMAPAWQGTPRRIGGIRLTLPMVIVLVLLAITVGGETVLMLIALVPQSIWIARGYPNGPIPASLYPMVALLFYAFPTATGALCRRWPVAVVLATAPAWIDLGAFAVAAASRIGPYYLAQQDHAVNTVGTLELFAALGALGWLARTAVQALLGRGEWGSR
jgi:hypothetical protein